MRPIDGLRNSTQIKMTSFITVFSQPKKIVKGFCRRRTLFLLIILIWHIPRIEICPIWDLLELEFVKRIFDGRHFLRLLNRAIKCMLPSKKILGVKASKSMTFELTGINGLVFNICSTMHNIVEKPSSVVDMMQNATCTHTPPKSSAAGGSNFHLILCWIRSS